jgi:uncharacterized protein
MTATKSLKVMPVRNGYGIVATKPFRRGALILEIKGKIVTADEVWRYWDTDPRLAANCIRYDENHYLDPNGDLGQYSNHSCNPNAGLIKKGKRLVMKAIAPIAAGDEVTHDYSTFLAADDIWTMRCNCGEANCRGVVRNIRKLPPATVRAYRRLGILPDFITAIR